MTGEDEGASVTGEEEGVTVTGEDEGETEGMTVLGVMVTGANEGCAYVEWE